jgi:hypothetical protein
MNVINRKGVVFVCGGMGSGQTVFNDAWVFNLLNLNWIKALFDKEYPLIDRYIFIIFRGIQSHITTIA